MSQDETSQQASHDPHTTDVMSQESSHDPCTDNMTSQEASHDPHTTDVTSQEASHDPHTTDVMSQEASHDPCTVNKASQEASRDPCITEGETSTVENPPKHANNCFTYLTDVASQLSDFTNERPIRSEDCLDDSDILNKTPNAITGSRDLDCDVSHDLDCDTSYDLDHDESLDPDYDASHDLDHDVSTSEVETSCEHSNTHLEDSVVVEDIDDDTNGVDDNTKELQYEFIPSNFTVKVYSYKIS